MHRFGSPPDLDIWIGVAFPLVWLGLACLVGDEHPLGLVPPAPKREAGRRAPDGEPCERCQRKLDRALIA